MASDGEASLAEWLLPAEAESIGAIRGGVREFVRARGADEALVIDVTLAVSEAVTNAVMHAFVDRPPGTVCAQVEAGPGELVVTVADDGRGMQPRADSPGLGMGLPTIASLTSTMDLHAAPGGGTVVTMTFDAPGVDGPARRAVREAGLLEAVTATVDSAWPGEGVERLVDLLVPDLANACALDAVAVDGSTHRIAGRMDGPYGGRDSAWLAELNPRIDAPESAARRALDDGGLHMVELSREHIARIARSDDDARRMAASGLRWWVVIPLIADDRHVGLLHFGFRAERGEPDAEALALLRAVADRAAHALAITQLIADLRRTRRRFERVLDVLGEAVTVQDGSGRMIYANDAAARLFDVRSPPELLALTPEQIASRYTITDAGGTPVTLADMPGTRLLAGRPAPPLLTRRVNRETGEIRQLLVKATLLDDGGERLAVNIIEEVP